MKLNTAKKLTAGALALSMMFAMAVPMAFAESETEVVPDTPASITTSSITKTLENVNNKEGAVPNITAKLTVDDNGKAKTKPSAVTGDAAIRIDAATVTSGTGAFTVHLDNITVPGIYTYGLTEEAVNEAGVKPNNKHYTLTVYALNSSSTQAGTNKIGEYKLRLDEDDGEKKLDDIENRYYAGEVDIKKVVTGNFANREQKFDFEVTLVSDLPVTSEVTIAGEKVTFTLDTTTNKYVATKDIQLKDGEIKGIQNLPYGVTYTVKEFTTDTSGNKTYAVKDNDELTVNGQKYTVDFDNETGAFEYTSDTTKYTATITNDTGSEAPDMGVILDNAPYMLMLAVVAGGAMTLVIKKRREEE